MGYSTDFHGQFNLDAPLTAEQKAYLTKFNQTRRMSRDPALTALRPDPVREAVGLPLGPEGAYFVGETGFMGQDTGPDVLDSNDHGLQPSRWCGWVPNWQGNAIEWDGGEKFYAYEKWLEYIIEHFLKPWGRVLNGEVTYEGESPDDFGKIEIKANVIRVREGIRTYAP